MVLPFLKLYTLSGIIPFVQYNAFDFLPLVATCISNSFLFGEVKYESKFFKIFLLTDISTYVIFYTQRQLYFAVFFGGFLFIFSFRITPRACFLKCPCDLPDSLLRLHSFSSYDALHIIYLIYL